MKKTLKDIATIQTGLFAKPIPHGEIVYLQSKHFDEYGRINSTLHPDLKSNKAIQKHLLKPGDILFSAKGTKNFASIFESHNPASVASTSFFVIRLKEQNILPEFLMWFLNHQSTQRILKGQALGTSMASISKVVLEDLEISVPSMEIQKAVLQITNLRNTEKKLHQQIQSLREKQIQQQIINAIK